MVRTRPPLKLARSPLAYVLGQVRFSPVLSMEEYVPPLQEAFRKSGYPRFREEQISELIVLPQPAVSHGTRWVFTSKDQRAAIVLTDTFVVFEVSTYDVFEKFVGEIEKIVRLVEQTVSPELCERVGLRYVDLIAPSDGPDLDDLLQPGLLGLDPERLGIAVDSFRYEVRGITVNGRLIVRLFQSESFLPPDISAKDLTFEVPLADSYVLLDIDHYSEDPRDFEPQAIIDGMWLMHDQVDLAFRESVTPAAMKHWGAEEVDER